MNSFRSERAIYCYPFKSKVCLFEPRRAFVAQDAWEFYFTFEQFRHIAGEKSCALWLMFWIILFHTYQSKLWVNGNSLLRKPLFITSTSLLKKLQLQNTHHFKIIVPLFK